MIFTTLRKDIPKRFKTVAEAVAAIESAHDVGSLQMTWRRLPKRGRELSGSVKKAYDAKLAALLAADAARPVFSLWGDE